MFISITGDIPFKDKHKETLRHVIFSETQPGSITHDFDAMLAVIREEEPRLTEKQVLQLKTVESINERLHHPLDIRMKRKSFKGFPHIMGLYMLARTSGITHITGSSKKAKLVVNEAAYERWQQLNHTEKYGNLLEFWLLKQNSSLVGEGYNRPIDFFMIMSHFYMTYWRHLQKPIAIPDLRRDNNPFKFFPGVHNMGLLELFGWLDVDHGTPDEGDGLKLDRVARTPLADALLAFFYVAAFKDPDTSIDNALMKWHSFHDDTEEMDDTQGELQKLLQPYWTDWQTVFKLDSKDKVGAQFREGLYTVKVELVPAWRAANNLWARFALDAHKPLDALVGLILRWMNFDFDHLYMFAYQDAYGNQRRVTHPFVTDHTLATNEVQMGELGLDVGQTMRFTYDFGDDWQFEITIESIDEANTTETMQHLEDSGVKPPAQYEYDDDEFDEDE